jgi:hypothetical protein
MHKKLYIILTCLCCGQLYAQIPEDALRMSWMTPSGTARQQAIGGAMGSLGGEISSIFVNPAGLGFYKNMEIVLTPGYRWTKTKGSYRESDFMTLKNANSFQLGTTGFVGGWSDKYSKWKSKAIGIAVNQTANFNKDVFYSGSNDYSSWTENPTNEFFNYYTLHKNANPLMTDAAIVNNALGDAGVSLPTKMGLYTYLIDIDSSTGQKRIVSRAEEVGLLDQSNHIRTRGGVTEIALAFAANMDDKLYIGGTFGVPIVNYKSESTFTERDATGGTANKFNYFSYQENYESKGVGINAKLGMIFKPKDYVRLGLAIHTPTLYGLTDTYSSKMVTDVENRFAPATGLDSVNSTVFTNNAANEFNYDLSSPWKFIVSGSYVFREVEDITRQKGFITADIEYTNYTWSSFSSAEANSDDSYYKGVNSDINDAYRGTFNFRVGGELKFKTIMTRLGFAYYGNPYSDKSLKAKHMLVSGGLGYRNKGMFIDLTYVQQLNKDVNFPYRLTPPRQNTFAELKENGGNLMLTVGFKI